MKNWLSTLLMLAGLCRTVCAGEPAPEVRIRQVPSGGIISNRFEVTIRNTNNADIILVKPLNGSAWAWYLPFYSFHVTGSDGKELRMATRHIISGLYPGTEWPADYLVALKPGGGYTNEFDVLCPIPESAEYTVRFDYVMDIEKDRFKGQLLEYPAQVWHGTASSKPGKYRLIRQRM